MRTANGSPSTKIHPTPGPMPMGFVSLPPQTGGHSFTVDRPSDPPKPKNVRIIRDGVEYPVSVLYAGRRDGLDWWVPMWHKHIEPTDRIVADHAVGSRFSGFEA